RRLRVRQKFSATGVSRPGSDDQGTTGKGKTPMKGTVSQLGGALVAASAIVAASTVAFAVTKADVSNHSITCNTVSGTAKFKPGVGAPDAPPPGPAMQIMLKGKVTDCVDNTDAGVLIDSGTFSGTLTDPTTYCPDLITTGGEFQP